MMDENSSNIIYSDNTKENPSVLDFPLDKKVEMSGPTDGLPAFEEITSHPEEQHLHDNSTPYAPIMRRIAMQTEIALKSYYKKEELVWKNRGLSATEGLHSAASKDAFDLKSLQKSLPSTPPIFEKTIARRLDSCLPSRSWLRMKQNDPSRNCSLASYTSRLSLCLEKFAAAQAEIFKNSSLSLYASMVADRSNGPALETIPSVHDSMKDDINETKMRRSLMRAQQWSRRKRLHSQVPPSEPEKETSSDNEKETKKEEEIGKFLHLLASQRQEMDRLPNFLPKYEEMPIDRHEKEKDKMNEEISLQQEQIRFHMKRIGSQIRTFKLEEEPASNAQKETSIDVENSNIEMALNDWACFGSKPAKMTLVERQLKQNSVVENPLHNVWSIPKQDEGQCSSWDSERNWNIDFMHPDFRVPLNSPIKTGDQGERGPRPPLDVFRTKRDNFFRIQRKLNILKSYRGAMDESEGESAVPQPGDSASASSHNHLNSSKEVGDLHINTLKKGDPMIRNIMRNGRESAKNIRSFQSYFPLGSAKSDKVVPD